MPDDRKAAQEGWIFLAGVLMVLMGSLDFFQGLIAIARNEYYTLDPNEIIVFDLTTWGWITLFWGSIVAIAGLGIFSRRDWARWLAISVASVNVLVELGFIGGAHYPLSSLTVIAINLLLLTLSPSVGTALPELPTEPHEVAPEVTTAPNRPQTWNKDVAYPPLLDPRCVSADVAWHDAVGTRVLIPGRPHRPPWAYACDV